MPYTAILGLCWAATWALLVASFGAVLLANGLDRARRAFAVRVAAVGLLAGAGLVTTVAIVAAGVLAWVHGGWVFAAPILTVAGVLVGPAIAVALLTLPTLVRLVRTVAAAERPTVAASPRLVTPLHALAAAAVVAIYRALAVVAQPPYIRALAGGLAIVAVAAALSAASQRAIASYRLSCRPTTQARVARWAAVSLAGVVPTAGLTAQTATVTLDDGTTVDAWTFDGTAPGPELHVTVGELLEVTLTNRDIPDGVTIHWHGVEVPNAEDGVAGVTQDAVRPGESYVYRFRPTRAGTFWYHSHQSSSIQVARGLYGVLVVKPSAVDDDNVDRAVADLAVAVHTWDKHNVASLGRPSMQQVKAGASVRLRLLNTDNTPVRFAISGTLIRLVAVDGNDVREPAEVSDVGLFLAAGGRYDVAFTMPERGVTIRAFLDARERTLAGRVDGPVLTLTTGADAVAPDAPGRPPAHDLDLATYGRPGPAHTRWTASSSKSMCCDWIGPS